jgi:sirohydrochlorin ferrochelatase
MKTIMLVDNGSRRADATLALRRVSRALAERLDAPVHPVSLLHSSKVPSEALDGQPADTLEPFLMRQAEGGRHDFLAVPLFFGPSRALTKLIPETVARINAAGQPVRVEVADALCPLPAGEPRLALVLDQAIRDAMSRFVSGRSGVPTALLVDHGSPIPQVTAVRHWLAERLTGLADGAYSVAEAAMERRDGAEYAFNGDLLEEALARIGTERPAAQVVIAMQFLGPGRHAGEGGDVATICRDAQARHPELELVISRLVGEDPRLVDILADRARARLI